MKHISTLIAATCLLASCNKETPASHAAPAVASEALLAVLSAEPKGEAQSIHVVRETARPGDEVTLKGRIMGNARPFVDGRAAFILGDPEIISACSDIPGDNCSTPWDTCCNTPEEKKTGTATIRITGENGQVLREGLEGVGGLENLATLTVTGNIAEGSSTDLLIVNATAIQLE